ncbi:MAG: hypothetical protein LC808_23915 [Actinobacteria bacterium]|nr:hypothetical protein [Actinomycetota bacterium]
MAVPRVDAAPLYNFIARRFPSDEGGGGVDHRLAANVLGVSWRTVSRLHRPGTTLWWWRADEYACRLGVDPYQIWPDFDRLFDVAG